MAFGNCWIRIRSDQPNCECREGILEQSGLTLFQGLALSHVIHDVVTSVLLTYIYFNVIMKLREKLAIASDQVWFVVMLPVIP